MGQLVDGAWTDQDQRAKPADGGYQRPESPWRDLISNDGSSEFPAETGRYHLYVNVGCPWAYRTLLYRKLKGLEDVIGLSCTRPAVGPQGWTFVTEDGTSSDELFGLEHLHQIYTKADPNFTGRVTVPVLWDTAQQTIVNNESSEIIRMLNSAFDAWGRGDLDFYPTGLRDEIDALNAVIYRDVNNGVYRCGFAGTQAAYEKAYDALFATLDDLDARLGSTRYLLGGEVTEADWRLLPTLQRFDVAYYGLFRCNKRRLTDYENLWPYARDLYQYPGVAETADFEAFKRIYWSRTGLIPKGPDIDWTEPAGRL